MSRAGAGVAFAGTVATHRRCGKNRLRFFGDSSRVKAFLISIAVLMSADAAFNHGDVTKAVFHGVIGAFHGTGGAVSDSIFSR